MKINQKSIRNFIVLSCIVLVLCLAGCLLKPAVTPPLPEQPTFTHYRVTTQTFKDVNPAHAIEVAWRANSIDYSFKIFKSVNGDTFEELFDDGVDQSSYYQRKSCSCSFTDIEVQPGNQYSYYVLAYDEKGEIGQTETFSRKIFLPPCTLKAPQDNAIVDTPIPTFSWNNQELTKYLTKSKAEGYLKTHLKVNNETIQEEVWNMTFEDSTVDNVTYNLDDTGEPLENEHEYEWFHWTDAYDAEGNLIANAYSNSWHFIYKGPIKAVLMGKIMVPETSKSISKDITGTIPLVDATITFTDSEGNIHTGTTQAQGQYIFPQVAPGTNYIITAVGEVDSNTIIYMDVVPSIALHEVFDAGIADAESTALALVMEAMLANDSNLTPEEINIDDILNATSFASLVSTVEQVLNSYGNVKTDTGVAEAVDEMEIVLWLDQHAAAWLSYDADQIVNMIDFPFMIKNYNWDTEKANTEEEYISYLEEKFEFMTIEKFYYQNNDVHFENQNTAIVYCDKHIKYTVQSGNTFDEINKVYFRLIKTETGWKADEYRVLCTVPMTRIVAELIEENGNYEIELYWRGYTYQDYEGSWKGADTESYRIYRKVDNGEFVLLPGALYNRIENEFWFIDNTIELGKAYSYYITADGGELQEESAPSCVVTVDTSSIFFDHAMSFVQKFGDSIEYSVSLQWIGYPDATNYRVYRSINPSSGFSVVTGELEYDEENQITFNDYNEIGHGVTYYYYVIADLLGGGTVSSPTITIDTWFPVINLTSPAHNEIISDPNPTFTWQDPGITFPYPPSVDVCGGVDFEVNDETTDEEVCDIDNFDLSDGQILYNGIPLVEGHEYSWMISCEGDNENGFEVANSSSEVRFYYGYQPWEVNYFTETISPNEAFVGIRWNDCTNANNYKIYKSTDNINFDDPTDDYTFKNGWYKHHDFDVTIGETYYYKVEAYNGTNLIKTSAVMVVNTWLPGIIAISPINDEVVTVSNPTFSWQYEQPFSFPYGSFEFAGGGLIVNDSSTGETIWDIDLDDYTTLEITYIGPSLTEGQRYNWERWISSEDEEGNGCNTCTADSFYYGSKPFKAEASSITGNLGDHQIEVRWPIYENAGNYKVYRSTNGGSYVIIFDSSGKTPDFYDNTLDWWINQGVDFSFCTNGVNINIIDFTVTESNSYSYYVVAYGGNLPEEISSNETIAIYTWLPACWLVAPANDSIVTDPHPLLEWYPPGISTFPYGQIFEGEMCLKVADLTASEEVLDVDFYDLTTSSIIYDGKSLVSGHSYIWRWYPIGLDQNGHFIAEAIGGTYQFTYNGE